MGYKRNPLTKQLDYFATNPKMKFTADGGLAIRITNKTGAPSVAGTIVEAHESETEAVKVSDADCLDPIGVVYEDDIADGMPVLVVIAGMVSILLEDGTASTVGYWARTSITDAGRADITNSAPPGSGIVNHDVHIKELGHCIESVSSGTDKKAKIIIHFN